jgi:hypothetical protein
MDLVSRGDFAPRIAGTYQQSCAAASISAAIGGGAWKSHALNRTAFGTPMARDGG